MKQDQPPSEPTFSSYSSAQESLRSWWSMQKMSNFLCLALRLSMTQTTFPAFSLSCPISKLLANHILHSCLILGSITLLWTERFLFPLFSPSPEAHSPFEVWLNFYLPPIELSWATPMLWLLSTQSSSITYSTHQELSYLVFHYWQCFRVLTSYWCHWSVSCLVADCTLCLFISPCCFPHGDFPEVSLTHWLIESRSLWELVSLSIL